jgi:MraZ protein
MYLGRYSYNLDDKGRLAIPAKLRSGGEDGEWVLAQGLDHCLFLYPMSEWGEVSARIQSLAANRAAARRFARILFAGAVEVTLDRQGRVNIPAHLREWASLEREAVVVGVGRRIEIWDKKSWQDYTATADYEEAAEKLADLEF